MSNALDTQIDGNHYKRLKMQPLELAYRVNGSPCFTKLAKYASRSKVDRLGDLRKAIHCIQLEQELGNPYKSLRLKPTDFIMTLESFCEKGGFLWGAIFSMYYGYYEDAINFIQGIIQEEFPDET